MIPKPNAARCVLVDGPYEIDADGAFDYAVCFGDDDGEPVGQIVRCESLASANDLGRELARRYNLELVAEATPA